MVSLYIWINLHLAAKDGGAFRVTGLASESALATKLGIQISPTVFRLAIGAVAALGALFAATIFYAQWDPYPRFRYGGLFGLTDSLFRRRHPISRKPNKIELEKKGKKSCQK